MALVEIPDELLTQLQTLTSLSTSTTVDGHTVQQSSKEALELFRFLQTCSIQENNRTGVRRFVMRSAGSVGGV